jgi:hypothetical protein
MRLLLILTLLTPSLFGTDLWLRTGGPESAYRIQSISMGTPAVVSVVNHSTGAGTHNLVNGDKIWVHSVRGCQNANSYQTNTVSYVRTVKNSNQGAGTFALGNEDGSDFTCNTAFETSWQSGWVGKVELKTLNAHPRLMFPSSGAILDRSKDPDGAGAGVAPVVTENGAAWQGMVSYGNTNVVSASGCDGVSPILCAKEEAWVQGNNQIMDEIGALAYVWFADNSRTNFLNAAKYLISRVNKGNWGTSGLSGDRNFACAEWDFWCGVSSFADWISDDLQWASLGYDIVRDQLTVPQRQAFAQKILNNQDDGCTPSLQYQTTVNIVAGSSVIGGSGLNAIYAVGDKGLVKPTRVYGGNVTNWFSVTSVAVDGTSMTVSFSTTPTVTANGVDIWKIMPWTSTTCGAWYGAEGHEGGVYWPARRYFARVSASYTSSDTSIQVLNAANLPTPPFQAQIESEIVNVTAIVGNTLTVQRAQKYSTAANYTYIASTARYLVSMPRTVGSKPSTGAGAVTGPYKHNIAAVKMASYVVSSCTLADDDARAATYCQDSFNQYYDLIYQWMADYWAPTPGSSTTYGYQYGRWPMQQQAVLTFARYGLASPIDMFGPWYWRMGQIAYQWTPPGNWRKMASYGTDFYKQGSMTFMPTLAMLNPNTAETKRALYWWENLSNLNTDFSSWDEQQRAPWVAAYYDPTHATEDFRITENPWTFNNTSEVNPNTYYGVLMSRSGWGPSDSMLVSYLGVSEPCDHWTDLASAVPGTYYIFKNTNGLISAGTSKSMTQASTTTGNQMQVSGLAQKNGGTWWYQGSVVAERGGQMNQIDRSFGSSEVVYARGNHKANYSTAGGIQRQYRHILHWKPVSGAPEYMIVFDDIATLTAKTFIRRENYLTADDPAYTLTANGTYTSIVHKRPSTVALTSALFLYPAMVSTAVLYPGASATATYAVGLSNNTVTYTWTGQTAASMFSVHRIAAGVSDVMPTVQSCSTGTGWACAEIVDGANSRSVVIAMQENGSDSVAFSTTFANGKVFVSGLNAGTYDVTKDGAAYESNIPVGADGTLRVDTGGAGAWSALRSGASPPGTLLVSPSTMFFSAAAGSTSTQTGPITASCAGIPCTPVATESCAWLSVGAPSGSTYTVTVNPTGLAQGSYSCGVTMTATGASGSPQTVTVNFDITAGAPSLNITTTTLPNGTVGLPYSQPLTATGGVPPYNWSVASGALPAGVAVIPDAVAGTPTAQTVQTFTVQASDSSVPAQTDTQALTLTINAAPAPGVDLTVEILDRSDTSLIVRYGRVGLEAQQTCTVAASTDSSMTPVVAQVNDTGGYSRRLAILTGLTASTTYYVTATCGQDDGTIQTASVGTLAGTAAIPLRPGLPPYGATQAAIDYSANGTSWTNGSPVSCASGCALSSPEFSRGAIYYFRHRWISAGGSTVATGVGFPMVVK